MTNHTPGPWVKNGSIKSEGLNWITTRSGKPICDYGVTSALEEEAEANGNLIKAAPDLLSALKELLFLYQRYHRETTTEEVNAEHAIAKAEGKNV